MRSLLVGEGGENEGGEGFETAVTGEERDYGGPFEVSGGAQDAIAMVREHVQWSERGGFSGRDEAGKQERVVTQGGEEEEGSFCRGRHCEGAYL